MVAIAGLAILHGTLAALLGEALLRMWRVRDPGERVALRWLALAAPLLLPFAFHLLAPIRSTDEFATAWALFAGTHWNQVRVGAEGLASIATIVLAISGALLYLRDALPFLDDRVRRPREQDAVVAHPGATRVKALITEMCPIVGVHPEPDLVMLSRSAPVLLCTGVDRPTLVISSGTLDRLGDEELRAALAHELAHASTRDPLAGWLLMVLRTVAWFSPAAQIVGRQIVQELEYRADMAAIRVAGSAPLRRAIAALADSPGADSDLVPLARGLSHPRRLIARAKREAIEGRCGRMSDSPLPGRTGMGALRFALAATGLTVLLFFVV